MPFDPYFQSESPPAKAEPEEPAEIRMLPDPPKDEPAIFVAQKIKQPRKVKPKKAEPKHIGKFQPFNEDTVAKAKCDILRFVVVSALECGKFELAALLHLANLWGADQDVPDLVFAKPTLTQVLSYKPIAWKYQNNRVWRTKKLSRKRFKQVEQTALEAMIALTLNKMVQLKEVQRVGTNRFKLAKETT